MEAGFWESKWASMELGFHMDKPNPSLTSHIKYLDLPENGRVFVPLCGKTLDIGWLLERGYRVAGVELVESAVQQLFAELRVDPVVKLSGRLIHYHAPAIDIFAGNIFELSAGQLGSVDAVYDRAALVALPPDMRVRYAQHLVQISHAARQLLVSFEYDQQLMPGPPFSVDTAEINELYAKNYNLQRIDAAPVPGGLKGQCEAVETVWLLS